MTTFTDMIGPRSVSRIIQVLLRSGSDVGTCLIFSSKSEFSSTGKEMYDFHIFVIYPSFFLNNVLNEEFLMLELVVLFFFLVERLERFIYSAYFESSLFNELLIFPRLLILTY